VEKTHNISSGEAPHIACAGHLKLTNSCRQVHPEEEVLDMNAKFFSEDWILLSHTRQQKSPIEGGLHSEEMATKNFRVYKTSLRYTLHQQIPTLRQFHSEELRVGKRSSFQEQFPDVELQAQAPTNEVISFPCPKNLAHLLKHMLRPPIQQYLCSLCHPNCHNKSEVQFYDATSFKS
jgi:hypothetical protein